MTASQAIVRALSIKSIAAPSFVRMANGHDQESLTQLAESIKAHGLIQPIVVRPASDEDDDAAGHEFIVIAGRRRLAAAKLAKMDTIAAIVSETDQAKAYELEIAENIQREQMTLADTARAVRTLMMIHDSAKKVGQIVNKSPAWVSKHLTVTASQFPTPIAELMDRGIVGDLETLLLLAQIAKVPATNERAIPTQMKMLRLAHSGEMNRQVARDALASLKDPAKAKAGEPVKTQTTTQRQVITPEPEEAEQRTTFSVTLPIHLLAAYETAGGDDWLIELLSSNHGQ